jgi:hypothetical protein
VSIKQPEESAMHTTSDDIRPTGQETRTRIRARRVRRLVLATLIAGNLGATALLIGSATGGAGAGRTPSLVAAIDAFSPAR